MPLQATSGAASYDAFGGGVPVVPEFIEDMFSTYLYTGTGATQTITNGIDILGKGAMVWTKIRSAADSHILEDTVRGVGKDLSSNSTLSQQSNLYTLQSFLNNGYTVAQDSTTGATNEKYVSWTFRKQPKFFDVVTYTGDGVQTGRQISHSLNSIPGCVIVKKTSTTGEWAVWHRATNSGTGNAFLFLNLTNAQNTTGGALWGDSTTNTYVAPTSTNFTVSGASQVNDNGQSYVAYLFAHDAGGFGLTGTDNVISCGSYTGNGAASNPITLGYEPQWVLLKRTDITGDWGILDTMRGWSYGDEGVLKPNTSGATDNGNTEGNPTATGFDIGNGNYNINTRSYIYIAIRRGPMKVPTDATKVFGITTAAGTSPAYVSSFPVDVALRYQITGGDPTLQTRLTNRKKMFTDYDFAEGSDDANLTWDYQNGMFTTVGANANQYGWLMRRAPSFMDVVCYTGTGTAGQTFNHNLTVAPELMIVKRRSNTREWNVYAAPLGATKFMFLNIQDPVQTDTMWNDTAPTSSVFSVGTYQGVNASGSTYVAYLFATCAGVSKVGSYTGNGSTQTINCGFTGGARFVIIKRTDSTGGWYVYDTDRGMTTLTDPYFFLNNSAAQVSTLGSVTTVTTGFALNSSILAAINVSGGSYIFLAIA